LNRNETSCQGNWVKGLSPYVGLLAFCLVSPLSIAATNAAWAVTLVMHLLASRQGRISPIRKTPLDTAWALYCVASLLSVVVSLDPVSSIRESRALGLVVIYYLCAWNIQDTGQRGRLLLFLLCSTTLASLYGILQFVTGWDFLGHYKPETGRASGFFSLYLTFGEYLVIMSSIGVGICLWTQHSRIRRILIPALGLMIAGLVVSLSKGALLGLLAGWCSVFAIRGRKYLFSFWGGLLLLVLFIIFVLDIDLLAALALLFRVDIHADNGLGASNTQRLFMWWSGFRISLAYFFNGVGMHALGAIYPEFRHSLALEPNQWHLHSNFIHIGVTRGLFGLAAFVFVFLVSLKRCCQGLLASEPLDRGLSAGLLGALVGFLVSGLTEYCWEDSEIQMVLYALLGMQTSISGNASSNRAVAPPASSTFSRIPLYLIRMQRIAFPCIVLCMVGASFFLMTHEQFPNIRVQLLEVLAGVIVCGVVAKGSQPHHWNAFRGPLISCVVVFAGYSLTRPVWVHPAHYLGAGDVLWNVLAGVALVCLVLTVLYWRLVREVLRNNLFDTAMIMALLLWMGLCISTHLLLHLASLEGTIMEPSVLSVLTVCQGATLIYVISRIAYNGALVQRIVMGLLAATLFVHALQ